jgi:hypothetical protein
LIEPHLENPTSRGIPDRGQQINMASESEAQGEAYEEKNVHEVYQQIANHFSATRYKVSLPAYTPDAIAWQYSSADNGSHGQSWNAFSWNKSPAPLG